jgi:acetyl-CoA synthetase
MGSYLSDRKYKDYLQNYKYSLESPEQFWSNVANETLKWHKPWENILSYDYYQGKIEWFQGAKLNVSENCIDRHLAIKGDKPAIIWEGNEPGENRILTYSELSTEVSKFANVLKNLGVKKGERVSIYMPMLPELVIAMLACSRIGAIHSVVFAGFSAEALRDRIVDSKCKILITANYAVRGLKTINLKEIADTAIEPLDFLESVIVYQRTDANTKMQSGRDYFWHELVENSNSECEPESMDAEDPLFILYTSGSTGKPKGVLHTTAGYLLYASYTHKNIFDYKDSDIYFCAADIGWITGHSYIVYGPLANGATTILFESLPNYPDAGRYWDVVERHRVSIFYTAPTAIRAILKEGDHYVTKYDRSSLRVLGTVGEPINKDAWLWYHDIVGEKRCPVVDTWWQTETGGILIAPIAGATKLKPGSATMPFYGIAPSIVDDQGNEINIPNTKGRLCLNFPWPGQMRTVYGDHQRFIDTYFSQVPGKYFTGDGAYRDEDGFYWITGRVDDVLNVSGHRLGTAEIESAIVSSGLVAEAAVVGMPHKIKGTGIYAYCILKSEQSDEDKSKDAVIQAVRKTIGPFATPDIIQFVPGLPKTRSGKIMRRILRKIAEKDLDNLGDTTTLADPSVVDAIVAGYLELDG